MNDLPIITNEQLRCMLEVIKGLKQQVNQLESIVRDLRLKNLKGGQNEINRNNTK